MFFSLVTTDQRAAGKTAWFIFTCMTVLMGIMAAFNGWPGWLAAGLAVNLVLLTVLSFYKKVPSLVQMIFAMVLSFINTFMVSFAERELYPALLIYVGIAIMLTVYRSELLLLTYSGLILLAILYHVFELNTVDFSATVHITEFCIRIATLYMALFFLMVFIVKLNQSREMMLESVENARRTERYKSDFLANMSHEIRTPMNAIIGMCELILREENLSESVRENSFNIQASGRSLLSIINDILDYSKIDSGKLEIVQEEFNIASILNDVINMSEARRGAKPLQILVKVDPRIPIGLVGDEVRIRQIILNLMTNAIKFTNEGSVTLTVSRSVREYGVNLVVSVKDTGIGIAEENLEKLFTSFRQVDTRKNRAVEGTGLGLAISQNLVRAMGGFISVKSQYGVGSDFRFAIPMKVTDARPFVSVKDLETVHAVACFEESAYSAELGEAFTEMGRRLGVDFTYIDTVSRLKEYYRANKPTHIFVGNEEYQTDTAFFDGAAENVEVFATQDRAEEIWLGDDIQRVYTPFYVIPVVSALNHESIVTNLNERRGSNIRFSAPKARVLLVDDNIINLKVAMGLLQPYNMQVLTATGGPEAIGKLESQEFDLVFMDHMMPGMDGVEATAIIREMPGEYYKKLPIVALTANVANGAREMFLRSGFDDFLAKPIELSALDKILRTYLPQEYIEAPIARGTLRSEEQAKLRGVKGSPRLLDTEKGIAYMGGSEETYREILSLYAQEEREKRELIDSLYRQGDSKNYAIEVHALKSTSLNVGAAELSGMAKELEAAAKAGALDGSYDEKHRAMLKLYAEAAAAARTYLGEGPAEPEDAGAGGELTEISAEALRDYLEQAKAACRGFDGEKAGAIAAETAGMAFGGEDLQQYFGKAAKLAADFEYEAAEQILAELEARLGGDKG